MLRLIIVRITREVELLGEINRIRGTYEAIEVFNIFYTNLFKSDEQFYLDCNYRIED